jgi:hypothetical protein
LSLIAASDHAGRYEAAISAHAPGVCTVCVQLPEVNSQTQSIETSFIVELPSLETSQTWLNRPLLTQLAQESGGNYFEVDELDKLAAAVPNRVETIEERSHPRPLWDTFGMLVTLVGLLSTEWLLRKRFSLI